MKYLLSLIILVLLSAFDFYNPKGFNYQAIVRDASGNIKKNANVTVAFDIVDQSDNALYSESHSVTTNDFGIINLVIGKGSTSDDFSLVDWTTDELSIKVTLDGTVMGTSPLLSVPYANYANNGITKDQADAITVNTAKVGITSDQTAAIETNTAKVGLYTDDSDNTAAGVDALSTKTGQRNTAIGSYALYENTTGTNNTASGYYALQANTTGQRNTASGSAALQENTTGTNNTASGTNALQSNTEGSYNTASGTSALATNTTGNGNTASGYAALYANTTGEKNTASGYYALHENTTGQRNTASGSFALYENTEGKDNTASGYGALNTNTTGDNNTAIGSGSLNSSTEASNSAALGFGALFSVTTGNANTSVGAYAGDQIVTGSQNTVMGYNSGGAVMSGEYNVLIGANAGSQSGTTKKAIISGRNNTLVGTGTAVSVPGALNRTVIGEGAIGSVNNSVTLGNSSVTDVYAADDGDAVIHAKGITFSDGSIQTTAVSESDSKVTFNQVRTTGFTDTENVLEIGDLMIRVNNNYLEWKVSDFDDGFYSFYATVTIKGSLTSLWGSMNWTPNVGNHADIRAEDKWQEIVNRGNKDGYTGPGGPSTYANPGLYYYKIVEIELINNLVNESYKITAFGHGSGRATIKGEYWNFK